ncbi:MAG TPA: RHS repeat domain-containing protein [Chitinophaga sp.]|uniref:RHS repeat domain-containing protein n=1 Tax=Chitinophaga sp. TaxID=1869181 RepID=UPI002CE39FBC|nr:RHS repeat domain-containing protein [Chitinophaga sp.]HVI46887.1 RHS repeat domain-containing protein [Chitinophaga sp.]
MKYLYTLLFVFLILCNAWSSHGQILDKAVLKHIVPKSPEASSIEAFTNTPVNNATGIPDIQIPIFTLEVGDFTLPITLRYHASGVRVDELSTAAGLKWVLDAGGSIDRAINGRADEDSFLKNYKTFTRNYFDSLSMKQQTWSSQITYESILKCVMDIMVDEYSYNIPGFTGNLVFNNINGKFYPESHSSELDITVNDGGLRTFTITDDKGNRYLFGGDYRESSASTLSNAGAMTPDNIAASFGADGYTAWKLFKVITNKKDTINLEYEPYGYDYHTASEFIYGRLTPTTNNAPGGNCGCGSNYQAIRFLDFTSTAYLIKKISSRFGSIQFTYTNSPTASNWKRRLTDIIVYNSNNLPVRKFQLDNETVLSGKLLLTGLHKVDPVSNEKKESYRFVYSNSGIDTVGSLAKDIMGYGNGSPNTTLITPPPNMGFSYPFEPANREPSGAVEGGTLTEMIYPTGGKARYTYMMNKEGNIYGGGVIVKKIELLDQQGNLLNQKIFSYSGFQGKGAALPAYTAMIYGTDGDDKCKKWIFTSNIFLADGGPRSYFYTDIIIKESGADTSKSQITKEKYEPQYFMYGNVKPALKEKILYKGSVVADNNILEKTVFDNKVLEIDSLTQLQLTPGESFTASTGNYWDGSYEYDCATHYRPAYVSNYFNCKRSLTSSITKSLLDVGSNKALTTTTKYYYDSKTHFYPTRTVTFSSNKDSITNYKLFPTDTVLSGQEETTRKFMLWKHMYAFPIAEGIRTNTRHSASVFNSYIVNADSMLLLNSTSTMIGNNVIDKRILFKQYDGNGNLLEQSKADDVSEVYIWGYNNMYPVAKITGSNYNYVKSLISSVLLQSLNPDEQQLRDELNKIRVALRGKALVNTYTYKPLVGLSSETNPSGETTYYEYDGLGRLVTIRDHDRKVVKMVDYQYKAAVTK